MLILNVLPHLAQSTHLADRPRRAGKLRVCLMGTDPAFPEAVAAFDALLSTSKREGVALVDREAQALASALTDVKAPTRERVDAILSRRSLARVAVCARGLARAASAAYERQPVQS